MSVVRSSSEKAYVDAHPLSSTSDSPRSGRSSTSSDLSKAGGAEIRALEVLEQGRPRGPVSNTRVYQKGRSFLELGEPFSEKSFLEMDERFLEMESSPRGSIGDASGLDVESRVNRNADEHYVHVNTANKALAILAESTAKSIASSINFGVTRQYIEAAVTPLVNHMVAEGLSREAIKAFAVAAPLAIGHHLGEIYVRELVLQLWGARVVPTRPESVLPGDEPAQRQMKARQAAGRIGSTPADMIGVTSFGATSGTRAALGGTTPWAATVASAVGGGAMAAAHALLNLSTHAQSTDGGTRVPTHHVQRTPRVKSMAAASNVIAQSFKKVAGDGPLSSQLAHTSHDIAVRGFAALQGLLIANLIKAQMTADSADHESDAATKFLQGAAGSLALLGLGFFANLSLAARRGTTSQAMSGTVRAIKSIDPRTTSYAGGMHALMEAKRTGVGARAWNAALKAIEATAHTARTIETLPGHLVFDLATAAHHGARWMASVIYRRSPTDQPATTSHAKGG
ncbi:hypothetical protein GWC77_24110 [Paraburkholderia sp. NMBU_R16]|uniref:hypothetical protein n=1 Tax=Paraburkholderia sp. NMBU_R16 TaxID=2698676 RepID=UPI00156743D0|nr:hypothetical protein [Paraburkholderia sp. NMBU_R16]NRO98995.1 hypothetical protein [Paraburkholderia sp. NMBU_R16]